MNINSLYLEQKALYPLPTPFKDSLESDVFSDTEGDSCNRSTDEESKSRDSAEFRHALTERPESLEQTRSNSPDADSFRCAEVEAPFPFAGGYRVRVSSPLFSETDRSHSSKESCPDSPEKGMPSIQSEKLPSVGREEIIKRGELLSVADFRTVASKAKAIHSMAYRTLIHALERYETIKSSPDVEEKYARLKLLEEKANTYLGKKTEELLRNQLKKISLVPADKFVEVRPRSISGWRAQSIDRKQEDNKNYTEATMLLLHGIEREKRVMEQEAKRELEGLRATNTLFDFVSPLDGEALLLEVKSTLEELAPTLYTASLSDRQALLEQPSFSEKRETLREKSNQHLLDVLLKSDKNDIPLDQLPALIDQKYASAIKGLEVERFEEILKKYGFPKEQLKAAISRLAKLQKHIDAVEVVTRMNEIGRRKAVDFNAGTQQGFKAFLEQAGAKELQQIGTYRPASHLEGAAIIADWNRVD